MGVLIGADSTPSIIVHAYMGQCAVDSLQPLLPYDLRR
jgi:hypothetical protein